MRGKCVTNSCGLLEFDFISYLYMWSNNSGYCDFFIQIIYFLKLIFKITQV